MSTPGDRGSPPWCLRLLAEIDAADARAKAITARLAADELNRKPADGGWSVGQCLEHLCEANDVYIPAIASALVEGRVAVVPEITPGWFGRWFIRSYIEPSSRTKRGRAPRKIKPGARVDTNVLDRFLAGNIRARALVRQAATHDVNRVRFKNPFVAGVRFTVGTGLEILVRHQRRHLLQAERVLA